MPMVWIFIFMLAAAGPWLLHWWDGKRRLKKRENKAIAARAPTLSEAMAGRSMTSYLSKHVRPGSQIFVASGTGGYPWTAESLEPGRMRLFLDGLSNWASMGAHVTLVITHPDAASIGRWNCADLDDALKDKLKIAIVKNSSAGTRLATLEGLRSFHPTILLNDDSGTDGAIWLERYHPDGSGLAHNISYFEGSELNQNLDSSLQKYKSMYEDLVSDADVIDFKKRFPQNDARNYIATAS